MTQVAGVDVVVGLYNEGTYGSATGIVAGRVGYVSNLAVTAQDNLLRSPIITAGRGVPRPARGNLNVGGTIATTMAPETVGFWLKHAIGTPTTTGLATGVYQHTFLPTGLPVGFVVEKDYTSVIASKVERFHGMRVSSAGFSMPQEGPAVLTLNTIGKSYTIAAANLATGSLTDDGHTAWSGFNGIVKRGGTQIAGVISATMNLDNNMPGGPFCFPGTGETAGLRRSNPEGKARISGTIEMVFEDFTLIQLATGNTETNFQFYYAFAAGTGGSGQQSILIDVDHCDLQRVTPPLDTESGIVITYAYEAYKSGADLGLEVTLKNTLASGAL